MLGLGEGGLPINDEEGDEEEDEEEEEDENEDGDGEGEDEGEEEEKEDEMGGNDQSGQDHIPSPQLTHRSSGSSRTSRDTPIPGTSTFTNQSSSVAPPPQVSTSPAPIDPVSDEDVKGEDEDEEQSVQDPRTLRRETNWWLPGLPLALL
jgi:hypothetical protein